VEFDITGSEEGCAEKARIRPKADTGPRRAAHPVHERVETTQIYVHADMSIKERALARTAPPNTTPGRYHPPDSLLLAFLAGL